MESSGQQSTNKMGRLKARKDILAWIGGIIFILLMAVAIMGTGKAAHWNAISGHTHYSSSSNSPSRFDPEPYACNETNIAGRHGERCYGRWYYWKLPPNKATAVTRAVVWICYSTHQIFLWVIVYIAQMSRKPIVSSNFGSDLAWYNWALLGVNASFHLLHLGQTHLTYDALAQDVCLASSEGAVVLILAFILLMEYKDRGFMFMWPNPKSDDVVAKKIRLSPEPIGMIRKYHGYLFTWATTYVFWYHPMENTWGHVLGFMHGGMLFLQGSLVYTQIHLNRYWRLLNETWVLLHGSYIAYQTADPSAYRMHWPMYFLGFGFMLFFTQIFGLPLWKKLHPALRGLPALGFLALAIVLCGVGVIKGSSPGVSNFSRLQEMFYIPLELYALMFLCWAIVFGLVRLQKVLEFDDGADNICLQESVPSGGESLKAAITKDEPLGGNSGSTCQSSPGEKNQKSSRVARLRVRQVMGIAGFLFLHSMMIALSIYIQKADVLLTNTIIMFILVSVFCVCWSVAATLLRFADPTAAR